MSRTSLTPEEERRVQEMVEAQKQAERETRIREEARNRMLNEQRQRPGYKYN